MMTETYVLNIQRYSLHDGAGIRTTVFLKGCPMRCLWCCNPESQKYEPEISYVPDKCIGFADCGFCADSCTASAIHHDAYTGKAVIDRDKCTSCLNCAEICPSKAIKTEGRVYSVSEILSVVEKDAMFYRRGGGGLTVSGGEPLMHGKFLIPLLKEAQRRRINTAIETCGFANYDTLREAAKYLDTIFYDIKSANSGKHLKYTGCGNELILDNFTRLCDDFPDLEKTVRTPVIPGFNDAAGDIDAIRGIIKGKPGVSFETLPYHRFGEGKYKALGRKYEMEGKSNA